MPSSKCNVLESVVFRPCQTSFCMMRLMASGRPLVLTLCWFGEQEHHLFTTAILSLAVVQEYGVNSYVAKFR